MKRIFLYLFIILFSFSPLFGISIEELRETPAEEFPLYNSSVSSWEEPQFLNLLPEVEGAELFRTRYNEFKPEITVQRLYRIELTGDFAGIGADDTLELFTEIVNAFGNPGTQVGYTYYSRTREKDIVLFEDSFISDRRGRKIEGFSYIPGNLEKEIEYHQIIDELNTSSTVFKQTISISDRTLIFTSVNTQRIWFNIVPLIKAGDVRNELLMFVDRGVLFVFNTTQIGKEPAVKKLGIPVNIPSMFRKRMDVVAAWMEDQILRD